MISAAPKRELSLAYPMGKLDTGQGNGRAPERLEAPHHRGTSAFDRSMILLDERYGVTPTRRMRYVTLRKGRFTELVDPIHN